jgi:putative membrane protein
MDGVTPRGATPNTGSRARDHLANERTYLAWLRTGIAVAGLGVAIAKFAPHRGVHAVASGAILVFSGLLVTVYGVTRFRSVGRQLEAGVFAPARSSTITAATVVTALAMIAVVVLV